MGIRQVIFIIVSILVFVISIVLINSMYKSIGGNELGVYLNTLFIIFLYTIYAIYHLFTYKIKICRKDVQIIFVIYWISVSPYLTMWLWQLF